MNPLQEVANFLNRTGIGLARPAAAPATPSPGLLDVLGSVGRGARAAVDPDYADYVRAESWAAQKPAAAATSQRQGPTQDIYLQPGVGYFDRRTGGFRGAAPGAPQLPPPGLGTAPIIQGTRDGVTADRTQSDEYRTQLGQYEALQKKKQYEEADALGMQIWQQKYGKTPMAGPESRNPLMQSTFGYQSFERPSYEGQAPVSLEDSFSVAANSVPAPWNRQGTMVDLNRGAPELFAKQAEKTNPMNAFSQGEGISGAVKEFLGRMGR